jgi:HEAT repeat protein
VRAAAAYSIGALKAEAAPAIPRLIVLLSDSDVYIRRAAVFALGEIGPPGAASLGKLREIARTDSNEVVGSEALGAAARIEGRPILDSLLREPTKAELCAANRRAPGC